ncbi:MAG: DNA topoisomerase IB [Solirubrobacteraceae bacterium]
MSTMEVQARGRRLRRSDCAAPGLRRVRRGRGFSYVDADGSPIEDEQIIERVRALAIPPAWKDVWICPDAMGHLQATGIDAAGRKQYLYHSKWREHRDRAKFAKMLDFGRALPRLRRRVVSELEGQEPTRERVLACAVRLLDVGVFRIGSEEYADEDGGLGLATLHREHVTVHPEAVEFDYPAKGGARRRQVIADPASYELIATLRRRRAGGDELLAYRQRRRWHPIRSDDINDYLKQHLGEDFSAKDFRTWNGTVMAAVSLGTHGLDAATNTARKRAMDRAVREVSALLGNTPAVARRSYIDPRVFDRYQSGWTIAGVLSRIPDPGGIDDRIRARVERGVLDLLEDERESPALEKIEKQAA